MDLAEQVLDLSGQREALRLAQAQAGLISEKETAAASTMARMDQTSQDGLDMILQASAAVVGHERGLEELQRKNFQRLYIMLLVTLLASALSLVLTWHSVRQREALRDSGGAHQHDCEQRGGRYHYRGFERRNRVGQIILRSRCSAIPQAISGQQFIVPASGSAAGIAYLKELRNGTY